MSIEIIRDPFSPFHGKPVCTECNERVWSEPHTCLKSCGVCQRKVWGQRPLHKECCGHPLDARSTWEQLDIRRARNGQRNYYLHCQDCGQIFPVKHALVPDWAKQAEPRVDNSDDEHPCARCDDRLTEYHHFAPGAIFLDSDLWPGAWLCKACHTLWHSAMRESAGYRLHDRRFCDWADDSKRMSPRWIGTPMEQFFKGGAA